MFYITRRASQTNLRWINFSVVNKYNIANVRQNRNSRYHFWVPVTYYKYPLGNHSVIPESHRRQYGRAREKQVGCCDEKSKHSNEAVQDPNAVADTIQKPFASVFGLLKSYKKLSKFRLTSLVALTAMGGCAMAPVPLDLSTLMLCSIGTGLVSAAANTINQYREIAFDSQMARTKNRVLVIGQITSLHAFGFASVSATIGAGMLYFGTTALAAALSIGNLFLYTMIYTPMKRRSILNTWVGSVVGAVPPLIGWSSCMGTLDPGAWIIAGVLYAWQFPHFNALSWNLKTDYKQAGYRMMCVSHPDLCRRTTLRYTAVITALCLAAPIIDLTNIWFALESLPPNAYFYYLAYEFYKKSDSSSSRKLFRFSLIHLPIIMLLFLINKKNWYSEETILENEPRSESEYAIEVPAKLLLPLPNQTNLSTISIPIVAARKLEGNTKIEQLLSPPILQDVKAFPNINK